MNKVVDMKKGNTEAKIASILQNNKNVAPVAPKDEVRVIDVVPVNPVEAPQIPTNEAAKKIAMVTGIFEEIPDLNTYDRITLNRKYLTGKSLRNLIDMYDLHYLVFNEESVDLYFPEGTLSKVDS